MTSQFCEGTCAMKRRVYQCLAEGGLVGELSLLTHVRCYEEASIPIFLMSYTLLSTSLFLISFSLAFIIHDQPQSKIFIGK